MASGKSTVVEIYELKMGLKWENKHGNGNETDFYKAKRRISYINWHKKVTRIQLE